jgi:hypothetical protein
MQKSILAIITMNPKQRPNHRLYIMILKLLTNALRVYPVQHAVLDGMYLEHRIKQLRK